MLLELCRIQIATVSRDGHSYIWNTADGSKLHELIWKATTQHRFRNCRWISMLCCSKPQLTLASCFCFQQHGLFQ